MIESLFLRNFQIHQKLMVEFDPNITVIVGDNDRGKTAILRALKWLVLNRPSGEDFRTWDSKNTVVKLIVDGHTIRRKRGIKNSYSLEEQNFYAFGKEVPDRISNLLNISPESFQMQADPAFWMTDAPSQVARNLNKIISLEVIDEALTCISHEHRRSKILVQLSRERLHTARDKKRELGWIPDFVSSLEKLEQKKVTIEEIRKKQATLQNLIKEVQTTQRTIRNFEEPLNLGRQLVARGQRIQDKQKQLKTLEQRIREHETWDEKIQKIETNLMQSKDTMQKIEICPLCGQRMS